MTRNNEDSISYCHFQWLFQEYFTHVKFPKFTQVPASPVPPPMTPSPIRKCHIMSTRTSRWSRVSIWLSLKASAPAITETNWRLLQDILRTACWSSWMDLPMSYFPSTSPHHPTGRISISTSWEFTESSTMASNRDISTSTRASMDVVLILQFQSYTTISIKCSLLLVLPSPALSTSSSTTVAVRIRTSSCLPIATGCWWMVSFMMFKFPSYQLVILTRILTRCSPPSSLVCIMNL